MEESDQQVRGVAAEQPEVVRGGGALQTAAEVSVILAPVVAPIVSQVTDHLLNRPTPEPPPQVILPPGVDPKE